MSGWNHAYLNGNAEYEQRTIGRPVYFHRHYVEYADSPPEETPESRPERYLTLCNVTCRTINWIYALALIFLCLLIAIICLVIFAGRTGQLSPMNNNSTTTPTNVQPGSGFSGDQLSSSTPAGPASDGNSQGTPPTQRPGMSTTASGIKATTASNTGQVTSSRPIGPSASTNGQPLGSGATTKNNAGTSAAAFTTKIMPVTTGGAVPVTNVPVTTKASGVTTKSVGDTTKVPAITTKAAALATTKPPSVTTKAAQATTVATTKAPSGTTKAVQATTAAATTKAPSGTTKAVPVTNLATTKAPAGTTKAPSGTTNAVPVTTKASVTTKAAIATTAAAGTTKAPGVTTKSTSKVGATTAAAATTRGAALTTASNINPTGTTGKSASGTTAKAVSTTSGTRPPIPQCPTDPILIYQRVDETTTFFDRSWAEMKSELGSTSGNYWKGLDSISALTNSNQFKLIVKFTSRANNAMYQGDYSTFMVGDEASAYKMTISGFGGNFTYDAFQNYNGYKFTTKDRKNDASPAGGNCAVSSAGAWWYESCTCGACFTQGPSSNFVWRLGFTSISLKRASMLLQCK